MPLRRTIEHENAFAPLLLRAFAFRNYFQVSFSEEMAEQGRA
jgi:hypothetical protein